MLSKGANNKIVLADAAHNLSEVNAIKKHKGVKWLQKAVTFLYYMWSEEGDELYDLLPPEKRGQRVCNDFLDSYNYKNFVSDPDFVKLQDRYIETVYTAEYDLYIRWQMDADAYIRVLKNVPFDEKNRVDKMKMLKEVKELVQLGKELQEQTSRESKFRKVKKGDEGVERLFEVPDGKVAS